MSTLSEADGNLIELCRSIGPSDDYGTAIPDLVAIIDRLTAPHAQEVSTQPHPRWKEGNKSERHPQTVAEWDWHQDPAGEGFNRSLRRLNVAADYDDPRAPDQMALVLRIDLIRIKHDLIHKRAYFEHHTAPHAQEATGETREALPYKTPLELFEAFKSGAQFVLHYHGKTYPVTHMEPRERVVYVQPPGLPVKVFPDGRSAEGPGKDIWLAALTPTASPAAAHAELANRIAASLSVSVLEDVFDPYDLHRAYQKRSSVLDADDVAKIVAALRTASPAPVEGLSGSVDTI